MATAVELTDTTLTAIIDALSSEEYEWLSSLEMPVKLQISNGRIERYAPGHVMHYGELFLTVAGVKSCCWIAHGAYDDFAERLVADMIRPILFDQFKLNDAGFELIRMKEGVRTTSCAGLPNSWILANKNHPQYALVKQAFYNHNMYSVIDDALVGHALGYPATARGADGKISYMDATLAQRLRTCCITVTEYAADSECQTFVAILENSIKCKEAFARTGRNLTIDIDEHPAFAQWLTAMQTRTS
eukprot:12277-Heterococcus_DN1.PRE.2